VTFVGVIVVLVLLRFDWKGLLDLSFELEVLQQILTREHELAADWSEE
jgi:hypothetical protein